MNTYDNYKTDTFKTMLTTSMYIDLGEDDELVYIVFRPSDDVDKEHTLLAEVFTAYKKKGNLLFQFGLPCNHGDEIAVKEVVIENYYNGNLFWENDDCGYDIDSDYYNGELDDAGIVEAIKTALEDYENGAILEARDNLVRVTKSIDEYEQNYSD